MTERGEDDLALDRLLADVRRAPAEPGADFLAQLQAAALAAQPQPQPAPMRGDAPRTGGLRGWLAGLGGWPAAGGLAAATVAGFWIGVAPPAGLASLASDLFGQTVDLGLLADDDLLALAEG